MAQVTGEGCLSVLMVIVGLRDHYVQGIAVNEQSRGLEERMETIAEVTTADRVNEKIARRSVRVRIFHAIPKAWAGFLGTDHAGLIAEGVDELKQEMGSALWDRNDKEGLVLEVVICNRRHEDAAFQVKAVHDGGGQRLGFGKEKECRIFALGAFGQGNVPGQRFRLVAWARNKRDRQARSRSTTRHLSGMSIPRAEPNPPFSLQVKPFQNFEVGLAPI